MNNSNLKILFSAFTFVFTLFFKWEGLNTTLMGWTNNALVLGVICINYKSFIMLRSREYKWINISSVLWGGLVIFSSYSNQHLEFDIIRWDSYLKGFSIADSEVAITLQHTVYFTAKILIFILYFEYLNKCNRSYIFLKYVFFFLSFFVVASNINALTYNTDGIEYKIGTKFYVCYLNIILISVYIMKNNKQVLELKQKYIIYILLIITLLLSIKTKCTTMIIGTFVFYFLFFKTNFKTRNLLYNPKIYLISLFVFDVLFIFIINWILAIPFIQYIVVDILNEDLTLTGRVGIYAKLGSVLNESPIYGFGWGNSHLTSLMYDIGTNAQNGLLNMFIEIGVIGCCLYLAMLYNLIKYSVQNKSSYPIICFVYMMLFLSCIEIIYTNYFTAMITLLLLNKSTTVRHEKSRNYYRPSLA